MHIQTIKATDAARSFSDVINKVRYQGYSFNIQRGREIVAKITPPGPTTALKVADLNDFFAQLPHLDKKDKLDFDKDVKQIRSEIKHVEDPWD